MCEIDWKLLFDIIKSLSIIIASGAAVRGINSWRRELKWKRKYELAEEVLSLFYEVQESVSIIRSPLSSTNEGKSRKRLENEKPEDTKTLDQAYVVVERFEKYNEPFHKIRAIKYRFISVFGKGSKKPFNDIIQLTNKILRASNILGSIYWKNQGKSTLTGEKSDKHLQKMDENESIIWEG